MPHVSDRDYAALAEVRYRIRGFLAFSEAAARDAGVAPQHHQLLLAIRGMPAQAPATITRVAERLHLRHNSAVELVARAVRARLVVRRPGAYDRREVVLHLTPRGARVLERLSVAHRREMAAAGVHLVNALRTLDLHR